MNPTDQTRMTRLMMIVTTPAAKKSGITVIAGKQLLPLQGGPMALMKTLLGVALP